MKIGHSGRQESSAEDEDDPFYKEGPSDGDEHAADAHGELDDSERAKPFSVILEEVIDLDYEPTEEEIVEHARFLGIDVKNEPDLLWIARDGLKVIMLWTLIQ